jgi:small GTP-binding protein
MGYRSVNDTCHKNNSKIINFFVIAGQERFRSISSTYYRGANGVLLVYDITSKNSFQALDRYYEEAMRSVPLNTAFVLAGNKTDLQVNRQVSTDEGQNWANAHNMPFFEVSAKDLSNMGELVQCMYSEMYMKQWEAGAGSVNFKCKLNKPFLFWRSFLISRIGDSILFLQITMIKSLLYSLKIPVFILMVFYVSYFGWRIWSRKNCYNRQNERIFN